MVADTPVQFEPNWGPIGGGCPGHPTVSCSSNDMFMNYMDYTEDACKNLFTQGQRSRMRALFAGEGVRRSFIDSPLGMTLSGPDRICMSATDFTLGNVPTGSTVSWEVSPIHLFPTAGRSGTGTTASLQAWQSSTSGSVTLTFTVQTASCGSYQVQKQIWVGVPDASTNIVPNYQPICINEYTYFNAFYDMYGTNPPGNKEADITNFVWTPPSGVPCFTAGTKNEVLGCQFTSAHVGFPQAVGVRAVSSCGRGALSYTNFTPSYCFYFSVGINPNPARGRVTIELTETPLDEEARAVLASERKGTREYQEYSFDAAPDRIRVFDIRGVERLCMEEVPEGTRHELDISHLGPGVYVVHLEHRNGTVVRQLRVE